MPDTAVEEYGRSLSRGRSWKELGWRKCRLCRPKLQHSLETDRLVLDVTDCLIGDLETLCCFWESLCPQLVVWTEARSVWRVSV